MKTKLEEARERINAIDEQVIKLFIQRMAAVKDVVLYKKQHQLPIFDAAREEEIIQKNITLLNCKELEKYYDELFKSYLKVSKDYQKNILDEE